MNMASSHDCALPVLRPEEVLRREHADLFVDDGAEVTLTPQRREHTSYFARVQAKSFQDLQTLGLVPRGLSEEVVRSAIAKDDQDAFAMARDIVARGGEHHPCGCGSAGVARTAQAPSASRRSPLTRTYTSVRKEFNPALASVLSEHYKVAFRFDSILAQSVRGWASHTTHLAAEAPLVVVLFRDIRIGRGARLTVEPDCMTLYARGLYIHRTGTLVHTGAYLRIWASIVAPYQDWDTAIKERLVPWALAAEGVST